MARNFLRFVSEMEQKYIIRQINPSTELQRAAVFRLKNYIVECSFSNSKITKFYCKNYDKSYSQLSVLWQAEFGTTKSEDGVRGQFGAISRQLIEFFGDVDSIEIALKNADKNVDKASDKEKNEAVKFLKELILKIDGLEQVDDVTGTIPFAIDINRLAGLSETSNIYELSECQAELKLLKALSVRGIQNLFDDVDSDKLCYLLQVINQPVITNEVQEYEKDGKTRQAYKKHVNMKKVELLKEFEVVIPTKLRASKNLKIKEDIPVVEDMPKPVEDIKPVMQAAGIAPRTELPFRFDDMSELCGVIQEKLQGDFIPRNNSDRFNQNVNSLSKLFRLFTVKGLREYLKKFEAVEVDQVINHYR